MAASSAKELLYGADSATSFWAKPKADQIKQLTAIKPELKDESPADWDTALTEMRSKAEQRGVFAGVDQKPKAATTPAATAPPESRGILHALRRGAEESLASVDQFGESAFGAIADAGRKLPGTVIGDPEKTASAHLQRWAKEAREKHQKYLDDDAKNGGAPQTTGEKIAEWVAGGAGDAAMLLGTSGPAGIAAVEGVKNLNRGPVEATRKAVEGYVGGKLLGKAAKTGEKVLSFTNLPPAARRALTGAAVGAIPGLATGNSTEAASGAISGSVIGATKAGEKTSEPEQLSGDRERFRQYREINSNLEKLREQHQGLPAGEERDAVRDQMESEIKKLANLDEAKGTPAKVVSGASTQTPAQNKAGAPPETRKPLWPAKPVPEVPKVKVEGSKPLFPAKSPMWEPGAPQARTFKRAEQIDVKHWDPAVPVKATAPQPVEEKVPAETAVPAPGKPPAQEQDTEADRLDRYRKEAADKARQFSSVASQYPNSEEGQRKLAESLVDDLESRPPAADPETSARGAVKKAAKRPSTKKVKAEPETPVVEAATPGADRDSATPPVNEEQSTEPPVAKEPEVAAPAVDAPAEKAAEPEQTAAATPASRDAGVVHEPTRHTLDTVVQQAKGYGLKEIRVESGDGHSVNIDVESATPDQIKQAASALGESKLLQISPVGEQTSGIRKWARAVLPADEAKTETATAPAAPAEEGMPEKSQESKTKRSFKGLPRGTGMRYIKPSSEEDGMYVVKVTSGAQDGKTYLFSKEDVQEIFGGGK